MGFALELAALPSVTDLATVIGVIGGIVSIIIGAIYAIRFVKVTGTQATFDAKDEIIKTNEQTIEALEKRLGALETSFRSEKVRADAADNLLRDMKVQLEEAHAKYRMMEQFTAPAAIKELQDTLAQTQRETMQSVSAAIKDSMRDSMRELTDRLAQIQSDVNDAHVFSQPSLKGTGTWWWDTTYDDEPIWSDEFYRVLGQPVGEQLSAEQFLAQVDAKDRTFYSETLRRAIRDKVPFDIEFGFTKKGGDHVRLRCRGDFINGEKRRMVGTTEDVTLRGYKSNKKAH